MRSADPPSGGASPWGETLRVPIGEEADVPVVRSWARELALAAGLREARAAAVAIAVSEVARNILVHARRGEIRLTLVERGRRRGLEIVAQDEGPGIADVERALSDGYSTGRGLGLGLGLPGARRLVDEFELASSAGAGTSVTMRTWTD
jgi:serine/threonine-protein kinase RsbT